MTNRSRLEVKKTSVRFSNGQTIQKPGKKVPFWNGFNKMAANYGSHLAFSIRKPDTKSVRKIIIQIPDGPVFGGSL